MKGSGIFWSRMSGRKSRLRMPAAVAASLGAYTRSLHPAALRAMGAA